MRRPLSKAMRSMNGTIGGITSSRQIRTSSSWTGSDLAIGTPLATDIQRENAPPVVESDAINERNNRRDNFFATDTDQFVLDGFALFDTFDAQLIVDAKNDHAAAGVGQRDDFLCDALGIRKLNFEFEEGVFAAAHQAHQLSARSLGRAARVEVFLERAFADRLVPLIAAESFASHLCNGGAGDPPGCC